jgi:hypothetical protein
MDQNCVYGITAIYDKSVPFETVKSAIDERYAKWAKVEYSGQTLKAWRIEPERFAIQLSMASKADQRKNVADEGTTQVIFLAFGGKSACTQAF